jgi:Arc/MetJ-type ribon-helix-helix transcriptional regulator
MVDKQYAMMYILVLLFANAKQMMWRCLMKNVQISFDENLLEVVDRIASSSRTSRSAVVRKALKDWIKEREVREFEARWIRSLKETPDRADEAEKWVRGQHWSES